MSAIALTVATAVGLACGLAAAVTFGIAGGIAGGLIAAFPLGVGIWANYHVAVAVVARRGQRTVAARRLPGLSLRGRVAASVRVGISVGLRS
jgi:hypothetical protein